MGAILDPPISAKIRKMHGRSRWKSRLLQAQSIDQTRLAIADGLTETPAFSFLVIGDSGFGPQSHSHPQRQLAEYLATQQPDCRFLLHTGDVVYSMGAPEQYPANFIAPYREWLVGGEAFTGLNHRNLVFNKPFLAVPGNHDYYNVPFPYGLMIAALQPLRQGLKIPVTRNVSLRGSATGDTYARVFMDYLKDLSLDQLVSHLQQHYTTATETGLALTYQPGKFTRLPNRYYQFQYGGIDFFGLDSSTFNRPVEANGTRILAGEAPIPEPPHHLDWEQLCWLRDRLTASLRNPEVRGRILYLHHPPYVTEATKLHEQACLSVRRHLRWVLDAVAQQVGPATPKPLVNLTLSGHAHCFEYLRSMETGHSDSHLDWMICGGSGARVRSQHSDTAIMEGKGSNQRLVAKSQMFVGRHGDTHGTHWPYSFVRIDVQPGDTVKLVVRPFVVEGYQGEWQRRELPSLVL